ncbi:hypothetical protein IQ235_08590 [Oscillatoriales cyanobacterium LEGE 11467]|uniref:Uncharacterized protein n=1 Tax=Zarconia navalis LEGE 11467 TaxID=1828826 RepID=A0A928W031_9CYAN|nr:hypothetical protein [Zarconia navalis]MBE9040835.1 hypothetical protein [Zarconia navalis LEGE 11467]
MSPSNTLDESKTTKSRTARSTKSTATEEASDAETAANSKDKQVTALAVPGKSDTAKSLSVEMRPDSDLPQNRPVTVSHSEITETFGAVGGQRPIFASHLQVCGTINSSGQRPISAGTLAISDVYASMGNRPVASNEIDDPNALMGYLD